MAKASAASLPGNSCRCRSASAAVGWRTGSMTIFLAFASFSQCLCWCGAEAKGLAPQTRMQFASFAVRGSKPTLLAPYMYWSAAWPAALQIESGSTSLAPSRLKKRCGKPPASSEQVPV